MTEFWAVFMRGGSVVLTAGLTYLIGCLIAGALQRFFGRDRVRRFFSGSGWRPLWRAWLAGMLLPVCSLGAIPIMREMKKAGVPWGTVLAFGLTAPLFNPISVLFGLTLASPLVVLIFSLCSLIIVSLIGGLANRWVRAEDTNQPVTSNAPIGLPRVFATGLATAKECGGPSLAYALLGVVGVVLLSFCLPNGSLQSSVEPSQGTAPAKISVVALLVYLSPIQAMVQVAGMFEHGNSVGAAFVFFILGCGANLGTLAWLFVNYGWRRSLLFVVLLVGVVIGLGYLVDRPLTPNGVKSAGHTHAFDQFCYPVAQGIQLDQEAAFRELLPLWEQISVRWGLGMVGALILIGWAASLLDVEKRMKSWLENPKSDLGYDRILPEKVLAGLTVTALIVSGIISCYIYYPQPSFVFEELTRVQIPLCSAAITQNWDEAEYHLPVTEDWVHKLSVGTIIRGGRRSPFQLAKVDVLLKKLEQLEHAVEEQEAEEARLLAFQIQSSLYRLKKSWQ